MAMVFKAQRQGNELNTETAKLANVGPGSYTSFPNKNENRRGKPAYTPTIPLNPVYLASSHSVSKSHGQDRNP